jgi:hypothetical protein
MKKRFHPFGNKNIERRRISRKKNQEDFNFYSFFKKLF